MTLFFCFLGGGGGVMSDLSNLGTALAAGVLQSCTEK